MATSYPVINGHAYSFASIEVDISGTVFRDVSEISWTHGCEPGKLRGTSPQVLATTIGDYDAEGSITLTTTAWKSLIAILGDGYLEKRFEVTVTYAERGPLDVQVTILHGCRITKPERSHTQGAEVLQVKLPLHIMSVVEDGYLPLAEMLF